MIVEYTFKFKENLKKFPKDVREKFYKQAEHLTQNLMHPSLHAKKYDESRGIWQARADRNIRFYFLIEKNKYILLAIKKHPK